jgi:hypothetical protein
MTEYSCFHCGKNFARVWNRDRHVRNIHRRHPNQDLNRRIREIKEFETFDPPSIELRQNTRNTRNTRSVPISYQKEATYHNTGIIDDNNGFQDYVYRNVINSDFQSDSDINRDDEKIDYYTLVFLIRIRLWMFDRLFPNPYSPRAIMFKRYLRSRCITTESIKPLDDMLRKLRRRIWFT